MLLVRGSYHLWRKPVAFRDDYCAWCRAPRRSIAIRSFDVGHLFWIPLLPVGYWRHWVCSECGRSPHRNPKFRRYLRWTSLYSLVSASVMFWAMPVDAGFALGSWIARLAAPMGAAAVLVYLVRGLKEPSLRKRLKAIPPATDSVCPFCAVPLVAGTGSRLSCPDCNAVRY